MSLNKVLIDTRQNLTNTQKKQACANISALYNCGSATVEQINALTSFDTNIGNFYKVTNDGTITSFNTDLTVKENTVIYLTEYGWEKFGGTGEGGGGGQEYYAGDNIDIQNNIISVSGVKSVFVRYPVTLEQDGDGNLILSADPGLRNYGNLVDNNVVNVTNNSLHYLTTNRSALTINLNLTSNTEVPNFAVEISALQNCDITVTTTFNGTVRTLYNNADTGASLEAGKFYQLTCVGSCWVIGEFTIPSSN